MKKILLAFTIALSGCSLTKYLPIDHDSGLTQLFAETVVSVERLNCSQIMPGDWVTAQLYARELSVYAEVRKDPQQENIAEIGNNLAKAAQSSNTCDRYLKIVKLRLQVVAKALGGRK